MSSGLSSPGGQIVRSVLVEIKRFSGDGAARREHVRELRIGIERSEPLARHPLHVGIEVVVVPGGHAHHGIAR